MLDFEAISGFDWHSGNREKNLHKHAVTDGECEQVFFNLPSLFQPDPNHSKSERRYFILGQTDSGRRLFIAFTTRKDKIRVISARDMSRKEMDIYERINS
jgi:uncharacterized DUF497 family protein